MSDRVNNGRFSLLPDELCLRVLYYLSASDLCICMRVCRRWYVLCNDPSLWTEVEISCRFVNRALLDKLISSRPRLRSIMFLSHTTDRLSGWENLGDCWLKLRFIESITVVSCPSVVLDSLTFIVMCCPLLKCVRCECSPSFTSEHFLGLMTPDHSYRELSLAHCNRTDDATVYFAFQAFNVSTRLSCLQTLNLDGLNFLTDIGTLAILETCPLLQSLDLDGEMLTDKTGIFIGERLSHLQHLGISFCSHLTDSALVSFSQLHKLSSLRLRKGTNFTSSGFKSLFSYTHSTTAKGSDTNSDRNYCINTLDLSECQELVDSNLQLIAGKLPNLHRLDIAWCFRISDVGLEALLNNCKHLVTLKLIGLKYAHCEPLFLAPLVKLVNLDLSQTDLVDDDKLRHLKRGRPWLKILDYYGEEVIGED